MTNNLCWLDKDRKCEDSCVAYLVDAKACALLTEAKNLTSAVSSVASHLTAFKHQPPPSVV